MIRLRTIRLLHVAAIITLCCSCQCLKLAAIKEAESSCYPKSTCSIARDVDSLEKHNCDCSSLCSLHNTCCIDSPFLNHSQSFFRRTSCLRVGQEFSNVSVFMVDTCSPSYHGPEGIRQMCQDDVLDWSDPLANAPVTNRKSQITYKSLFCAICNAEKPQDLTVWQVMLDCSTLDEFSEVCTKNRDFVLNNIMFIRKEGKWGLWSWDKKNDWKFRFLPVVYQLPESLKNYVHHCRPDLISSCPDSWTDTRVRQYCESYMAAVYFPEKAFRNTHCAICNGVKNFTGMSCHPVHSLNYKGQTPLSFGLLLDLDLTDGDKVGSTDGCLKGQVYDPFSKKCRNIECPLPGYRLRDNQCVRE